MYADAVFEGGGVKGIGIVGAISYFEDRGYRWKRVAGTSSGSIIAALIASGYSSKEIKNILFHLDYTSFMDKTMLQSIPLVGKALGLIYEKGIYSGDQIEIWIESLLSQTGKTTFKDVYSNGEYKLRLIASDITRKEMLVLPDDLTKYGIDPMEFKISKAVRMSCSIPLYFKPYKIEGSYIVDGGLLSNFPVWLFDSIDKPRWPTFGFKIVEPPSRTSIGKNDTLSIILDIVSTALDQNEARYIKNSDYIRTITIPSLNIKTTDFDITKEQSLKLFSEGYRNAREFDSEWDFDAYIKAYRANKALTRREMITKQMLADNKLNKYDIMI